MKRPTHTPESLIKKVFRPGERSLPRNEIIERLEQELREIGLAGQGEQILSQVLAMPHAPVAVGRTEAIVELTYQPNQLFDLAYRYLRAVHAPKTAEQIQRELRTKTQFSWNQIARMLVLERDLRFVRYEGDNRWFLAEWKLANDHVYAFARSKGINQVSIRAISFLLEQDLGLSGKEYVFLPDLDDRFRLSGEILYIVPEDGGMSEPDGADNQAQKEVAAALALPETDEPRMTEEESLMNMTQTVSTAQEVAELLRQALSRLEGRNQQMAQEVVAHFQQSNMQAIEVLMNEKNKNEQAALGIQQVLAQLEQQ